MVNYAINGFGRIGRMLFRAGYKKLNFVAINSPSDARTMAHLLKYDSVYGIFPAKVSFTKDHLVVDGKKIRLFFEREPENIPWKELKVDVVAECSGIFNTMELASKHLEAGTKKVVLSAPGKDEMKTVVVGVNEKILNPKKDRIVSNASCTTNCFAPVVKVINDAFGIRKGFMVTIHAYTTNQNLSDGSHKDLRRARAAAVNLVPTSSGAAKAINKVLPRLKGKLHSSAIRAPVVDGSVIYFTCETARKASVERVNRAFKDASKKMRGVLQYTDDTLVSTDIIGNSHSSVFDSQLTEVDGDLLKVVAWYDNEWGYACRMVDVLKIMGRR